MRYLEALRQVFRRECGPGEFVFASLFLALSIFLLTQLGSQTSWLKGTQWFAQPRLWPTIALVGMTLFALLHFAGALASPRASSHWREVSFWLRSLEYIPYFLAYVLVVPIAGYMPSTIAFATLLAARAGYRSRRILLSAAAFGFSVAIIFRGLLQVKMPGGRVYEFLPGELRTFALTYL